MSAQHTPGPWAVCFDGQIDGPNGEFVCSFRWDSFREFNEGSNAATARLIARAPELLIEVEAFYTELADIRNEWPGRNTIEGQQRLCRLRDLICKATGRDAQDVQDDHTSRTAKAIDAPVK